MDGRKGGRREGREAADEGSGGRESRVKVVERKQRGK
jgi:hypothetical protein